ncbi:SURF1 family protein [Homoserinibacter sp. YIM 151385]|uniref:SURF1 family protein n=1 Tax=Homoserinibacter sp. YIM 151385 TaxID=2985506 RepID=UPI0022EFF181|nr:SURF1 family cytochrome oxidase biogenesis protein [Homoserinibacter sp. YIM 151385]WBU37732.1 hypothetical protein OF852_12560 [Homoserinibacter sp. YIM 151385]
MSATRSTEREAGSPAQPGAAEHAQPPARRMTRREFLGIARRPRWIGALALVLAVAAAFAALAQWQVSRSVESANVEQRATEETVPLEDIATTGSQTTGQQEGQLVEVRAAIAPGEETVLSGRIHEGGTGYWLVAHAVTDAGESLAVAAGWAATEAEAQRAAAALPTGPTTLSGRYLGTESPDTSELRSGERTALSVAELVNLWPEPGPVYGGYLVLDQAPEGLELIDAPPPEQQVVLNWLNVFYAAEWIIFAGFGFYLWYRLVKDEWEKEVEAASSPTATV